MKISDRDVSPKSFQTIMILPEFIPVLLNLNFLDFRVTCEFFPYLSKLSAFEFSDDAA